MIYNVDNPNMRNIDETEVKHLPQHKWAETKAFNYDQIQQVICTEYPDNAWTIDGYNKDFLMEDIQKVIKKQSESQ